ncbi:hypothetical protein ACR79T_10235 [Sphingobacterium spiritivorum]|uniref:hypothetical protein n=1 Tax=Sphingobacterium spiritivorum TaxID=258 RepID=UPI003DA4B00A
MLEIIVNNQHVDYPGDIQIPITVENPFMLEDRVPAPYSLSFELPPTPTNLRIFGYPNRLGTYKYNSEKSSYSCIIRFQAITIGVGRVEVIEYDQKIKVTFIGVEKVESLRQKMFTLDMGTVRFTGSYNTVNYKAPGNFGYQYAKWAKDAAEDKNPDYVITPIQVTNPNIPLSFVMHFDDADIPVPSVKLQMETQQQTNHLNYWNPVTQNFIFDETSNGTGSRSSHSNIFPQFRINALIKAIFKDSLAYNAFDHEDFKHVVMPTTYFDNMDWLWMSLGNTSNAPLLSIDPNFSTIGYDEQPYLKLNGYLPDVLNIEFVKKMLKLFSCTLLTVNGKYAIVRNDQVIANTSVSNWSGKLIDTPKLKNEEGKEYRYGYVDSSNFKIDEDYIQEVDYIYQMILHSIGDYNPDIDTFYYDRVFYIRSTQQYFSKTVERRRYPGPVSGQINREDLTNYSFLGRKKDFPEFIKDNKYDVEIDISRYELYAAQIFDTISNNHSAVPNQGDYFTAKKTWYVPRWQTDKVGWNSFSQKREETFTILLYKRFNIVAENGSLTYPGLTPYANDTFSLDWDGDNGLMKKFHQRFKDWIERNKVRITGKFRLTAVDINNLDITRKIHVNGRNFFIEKMQYTIRRDKIEQVLVDLIEA